MMMADDKQWKIAASSQTLNCRSNTIGFMLTLSAEADDAEWQNEHHTAAMARYLKYQSLSALEEIDNVTLLHQPLYRLVRGGISMFMKTEIHPDGRS